MAGDPRQAYGESEFKITALRQIAHDAIFAYHTSVDFTFSDTRSKKDGWMRCSHYVCEGFRKRLEEIGEL